MTQLDIPPISFARYLELLKRRRWQVIPTTLVGLLVGLVAALMIPRYYATDTTLVYQGLALDQASRTADDPMVAKVSNAQLSVLGVVPDALEKLEWIGTNESEASRESAIDSVIGRLEVVTWQKDNGRGPINVKIAYRDTDPAKAEALTNTVRDLWVESIREEFEESAKLELNRASSNVAAQRGALQNAMTELRTFALEHGLDPQVTDGGAAVRKQLMEELGLALREQADLESRIAATEAWLEERKKNLDEGVIRKMVEKEVSIEDDPALKQVIGPLLQQYYYDQFALQSNAPSHPQYRMYQARLKATQAKLQELAPEGFGGSVITRLEENPEYAALVKEMAARRSELIEHQVRLTGVEARIAQLEREMDESPEIWGQMQEKRERLTEAQLSRDLAVERHSELRDRYEKARTGQPFAIANWARAPASPTDPNITLVALAGCVIGLGAAIGLVLLIDFLRSTFKTVDDVGYALPVPVLGMMAYLETREERQRSQKTRRRASVAAASFLFLSLSLVTVYYVAPTRLPPVVLHALDLILGSSR